MGGIDGVDDDDLGKPSAKFEFDDESARKAFIDELQKIAWDYNVKMTTGGTGGKPKIKSLDKTIFDDAPQPTQAQAPETLAPTPEYKQALAPVYDVSDVQSVVDALKGLNKDIFDIQQKILKTRNDDEYQRLDGELNKLYQSWNAIENECVDYWIPILREGVALDNYLEKFNRTDFLYLISERNKEKLEKAYKEGTRSIEKRKAETRTQPAPEPETESYNLPTEPEYSDEEQEYRQAVLARVIANALFYSGNFKFIKGGKNYLNFLNNRIDAKLLDARYKIGYDAAKLDKDKARYTAIYPAAKTHEERARYASELRRLGIYVDITEEPNMHYEISAPQGFTAFRGADLPLEADGGLYVTLILLPNKGKATTVRVFVAPEDGKIIGYEILSIRGEGARYVVAIRNTSQTAQDLIKYCEKHNLTAATYDGSQFPLPHAKPAPKPEPEPKASVGRLPDNVRASVYLLNAFERQIDGQVKLSFAGYRNDKIKGVMLKTDVLYNFWASEDDLKIIAPNEYSQGKLILRLSNSEALRLSDEMKARKIHLSDQYSHRLNEIYNPQREAFTPPPEPILSEAEKAYDRLKNRLTYTGITANGYARTAAEKREKSEAKERLKDILREFERTPHPRIKEKNMEALANELSELQDTRARLSMEIYEKAIIDKRINALTARIAELQSFKPSDKYETFPVMDYLDEKGNIAPNAIKMAHSDIESAPENYETFPIVDYIDKNDREANVMSGLGDWPRLRFIIQLPDGSYKYHHQTVDPLDMKILGNKPLKYGNIDAYTLVALKKGRLYDMLKYLNDYPETRGFRLVQYKEGEGEAGLSGKPWARFDFKTNDEMRRFTEKIEHISWGDSGPRLDFKPAPAPPPAPSIFPTDEGARTSDVWSLPVSAIKTDTKRFQNRKTEYSEASVERIVNDFDANKLDPIVVWRDPENANIYVLSGHSRFEAHKRLGRDKIKARFFDGTESEAIRFAKVDANRAATSESLVEDIEAFRLDRDGSAHVAPLKKAELKAKWKDKANKLEAYSHLSPLGQFIKTLSQPDLSQWPGIVNKAMWAGELRAMYPHLTDAHEDELFNYMFKTGGSAERMLKMTKEDLFAKVNDRANSIRFDPDEPLALTKVSTGYEARADTGPALARLKEIRKRIEQIDLLSRQTESKTAKAELANEKATLQREAEFIDKDIDFLKSAQNALFGIGEIMRRWETLGYLSNN